MDERYRKDEELIMELIGSRAACEQNKQRCVFWLLYSLAIGAINAVLAFFFLWLDSPISNIFAYFTIAITIFMALFALLTIIRLHITLLILRTLKKELQATASTENHSA